MVDFKKLCRACNIEKSNLLSFYSDDDEQTLGEMYVSVTLLELNGLDDLPQHICYSCAKKLEAAFSFQRSCQKNEQQLRKMYEEMHQHPESKSLQKYQNIEIQFHEVKVEKSCSNDYLPNEDVTKQDEDIFVESASDYVDKKVENLQDSEEFEYIIGESLNVDIIPEELDMETEDFNENMVVENLEDVDEKSEEFGEENEYQNNLIKCVCCNTIYNNFKEYENHECITQMDNLEGENSLNKISSRCRHRCEFCKHRCEFALLGNLHRHLTVHKDIISEYYEKIDLNNLSLGCVNCGKQYIPQKKGNKYITKHKKKKKQFVCVTCGKVYNNRQSFKEHEFAHKGIKAYKCEYCGREFAQECVRRAHVKLHTGKDIVCPVCNKTFVARTHLRVHMTYHTNDLRFPCDMCPKRFRRNHVLQLHRKTHSGRRTEQCEHCDSCFYTKGDLQGHISSVHLKRYHCNLCTNRYSEPGRLRLHFLKVHNMEIQDVSSCKKKKNELTILMRSRK